MNIKKLNEDIEKLLESENSILDKIKSLYPENIEEDLTEEYKDYVIEALEGLLNSDQMDTYLKSLQITKRVSHQTYHSYMEYSIFGRWGDGVIRADMHLTVAVTQGVLENYITILAGSSNNPIGSSKDKYRFNPDFIFSDTHYIIQDLCDKMQVATKAALASSRSYSDYVRRTGDLS